MTIDVLASSQPCFGVAGCGIMRLYVRALSSPRQALEMISVIAAKPYR